MDLKYVIVKYDVPMHNISNKIKSKSHLFPEEVRQNSMVIRNTLKEILVPEKGHSKEEVERIIKTAEV
jgi:hypothetical protein